MKYFIHTFGCQSNKSDSERIAGDYAARGWTEADDWRHADNIIINTCAIRQRAEDRVIGLIRNIDNYFVSENIERPKLILTGCMTHHGEKNLRNILPTIDEILPIGEVGFNNQAVRKDKSHAWVPISEGCNSFCIYCIVPYSRGRERSRPLEDILKEVDDLVDKGYTEITLLGQNVNSWGLEKVGIGFRKILMNKDKNISLSDIPTNQSQYIKPNGIPPFVKLLKKVSERDSIQTIRFMTSNPWDFHDELIDEIAANPKIDKYIHLPIQSGSDKILRLMNRGYSTTDYRDLVTKIRNRIHGVEIGTDIIVGFPGETEEDFEDTVNLSKAMDWKIAFIAQYSPRPGTASHRIYQDEILPTDKKRRWEILDALINKSNLASRPTIK